jgi:hypothetical protein
VVIRQVSQNTWEPPLGVLKYGWWVSAILRRFWS